MRASDGGERVGNLGHEHEPTGHAPDQASEDLAGTTGPHVSWGRAWFSRAFREREVLIRSEGRVRFIHLKSWMQMSTAGALVALGLWAAIGTGLSYYQNSSLARQDAEIVEAKIAYERVRADLEAYRVRVGALARGIFDRQQALEAGDEVAEIASDAEGPDGASSKSLEIDLEELALISARIEGAFDRIATDLDLTEADRRRIVQSRDALHKRISTLEGRLATQHAQARQLTDRVATLVGERDKARTSHRTAAAAGADLARLLDDVRDDLSATDRRERALRGQVAALSSALDAAERQTVGIEEARDALKDQLADVRDTLEDSQDSHKVAARRIGRVVQKLAGISSRQTIMGDERGALEALEMQTKSIVSDLYRARQRADSAEDTLGDVVLSLAAMAEESGAVRDATLALEASRDGTGEAVSDQLAAISPQAGSPQAGSPQAGGSGGDLIGEGVSGDPVRHAEVLLGEIEGLQDSQRVLVARLSQETSANLSQTEALLRLAGLDVDAMLSRVGYEGGQGGPLVEVDVNGEVAIETGAPPDSFADDVASLEGQINRWRALRQVVRCVPLISPVDNYHVTSSFGKRKDPFNGRWAMHEGMDLGGWPGIAVMAAAPGVVVKAGSQGGYGNKVVIDHGCGIKTTYGHLRSISVKKGQRVDHRQTIGKLGSTGRSTGPHVHYEIQIDGKPVNPETFIEAGKHVFKI